jgi:hypothetical protein
MKDVKSHIKLIEQATKEWLQPDNADLKQAIERTVEEGLFSFEDIKFQIRSLKQKVDQGQISEWAERAQLSKQLNAKGRKVLCLHAGNLPLVGFQDALGCVLSGADYYGKLSSKDPYLLASYLKKLRANDVENLKEYSTELSDFAGLNADKVLFAGSKESVDEVKERLVALNAVTGSTDYIIRTAKFSMAYLENEDPQTLRDMIESVFRYGGKGCRSVAVIVSPYTLSKVKCHFTDYVEEFWLKNPQHQKPTPKLAYQFAYNKAINRDQAWLDDFLIQATDEFPSDDFTLHWVQGDVSTLKALKAKFGEAVQTVYSSGNPIEGISTEWLSTAQSPDLWWQPDGIEVIESIIKK